MSCDKSGKHTHGRWLAMRVNVRSEQQPELSGLRISNQGKALGVIFLHAK
jgi:hypothetical protein